MGNVSDKVEAASTTPVANDQPKKLKPCCACPETKKLEISGILY